MKRISAFVLLFMLLSASLLAQQTMPIPFQDSVRNALAASKNVESIAIGDGFVQVWSSYGMTEQNSIKKQITLMRKKGYKLRPHVIQYVSALVHAKQTENADNPTITSFLNTAQKVIENYSATQANNFLNASKIFFQHHAIHFDKGFQLYSSNDTYFFDFIEPPKPIEIIEDETPSLDTIPTDWGDDEYTDDTQQDDWTEDSYSQPQNNNPIWMNMVQAPVPPIVEGPVLVFEKATLNFVTRYDSVFLQNTKGSYAFNLDTFIGEGGSFDFTAALLAADSIFCELPVGYFFKANKAELKSEYTKLTYKGKLDEPISGRFEFKSVAHADSVASVYPRFTSYENTIIYKGVGLSNTSFSGGFTLIGNKISSASVFNGNSTLQVSKAGNPLWKATSPGFNISKDIITTENARITIFQENDSITHPMVRLSYKFPSDSAQQLLLLSSKSYMRYAPFSSSFFNVDFMVNKIDWRFMSDSLNLSIEGNRSTVPMIVESANYYDPDDYHALQSEAFNFHPLVVVANYCLKNNVREFYVGDLALYTKREVAEMQNAVDFLAQKGMVVYYPRQNFVRVKEKAIQVYRSQQKKTDYDNLKIHSVIDTLPNATLNFAKREMTIRGVEGFNVSDSLNCTIIPDSSTIVLLQNRDLKFDGRISAGNFEIVGKEFTLKYDSFFISMKQIDSIGFFVLEKNAQGQTVRRRIDNTMQGADSVHAAAAGITRVRSSGGTLYISRPNNKSGRIKTADYPRLDATNGGVIYFDRREILNGAYDRSVFFMVPPFKLDSLNDADPSTINFDGTFASNGMFPNFQEKLHTMPDKTLGFEHTIPGDGYPLFKGDGKIYGNIHLDKRGIRSAGNIDYLATNIRSDNFVFYPDSVTARGQHATMVQQQFGSVIFPQASFPNYQMNWKPKRDELKLSTTNSDFHFYDSTAQLKGSVIVSKKGVSGDGVLKTRGTELISKEMSFVSDQFAARHATFNVLSEDPAKPALAGKDVRLRFNLTENVADIGPEVAGDAAIEFPFAQFKTSIPRAHWDLNTQKITMSKDKDVPIEDSYFYTTRKDLDSLRFNAEKAEYDIKKQELKVSGIPYIIVADAKITPAGNEVLILENAQIGTLKNTTIIIDTLNGYHSLTDGVIDIKSRNEFSGYATYQYINFLKDTFEIKLTDFHLETIVATDSLKRTSRRKTEASQQTVAIGSVDEAKKLVLGAGMFYKGDMKMYATRPALELEGYIKLDIKKIKDYNSWIRYQQSGEETEVIINYDNALTEEGKKVDAGLHFDATDNTLYISFLNDKRNEDDEDFFIPSGSLFYDAEATDYKIEDLEKAAGNKLSGKVFTYNDNNQNIRFEGPVNLLSGNSSFNVTATVIGQGNLETNDIRMNSMVLVDAKVPSTAFDAMARDIQTVIANEGVGEGLGDLTELLYKVADIVGEREARAYEQASQKAYVSLATLAATAKPLNFANVNFKWSQGFKAFYSEGSLGVSNIGRNDINGAFEGFMEVKKNEDGLPVFNVFIKASPESWYSFSYEDNRLLAHSSNQLFNSIISKKTNSGKAKVGELIFVPGSDDETLAFINRFRRDYYGIEVPYSLSAGSTGAKKKEEEKKVEDDGF
ncbi:hypothetical protein [Chryseotalea sanaruensis]|nr:hypothetical protein [Chryseotalea sanaruensis]